MKLKPALTLLFKTLLPAVLGIIVLSLILAWLAGMFVAKIQPSATEAVRRTLDSGGSERIDEVHEVVKEYFAEAVGTLRAASRTEIAARVMAPISEIRVKAGDLVESGDLLISLDRRDVTSRLNQAQASLAAAQAALNQAKNDKRRDADLYAQQAVPQKRLEQSQTAWEVAQANVRRASEAVAEAEVNLSYTSILAPQAGTVVDRLAEPGDIAQPGIPLLVLYDPTSLRLEVPVMENLAVKLEIGDKLAVHIDALDQDVEAVVDEIVPQAQAASRSFLVKAALPRSERLYEGMFGRLRIPAGSRRHVCLATAAIQQIGQNRFVDVLQDDGRTLQRRFITTGRLGMPGKVEVLSGLEAGERVVIRQRTEDG